MNNYIDELWVYICERVLQKTVSTQNTTFCRPLDANVLCYNIKIYGNKVKVKKSICSYTIIDKSELHGIELLFKHTDMSSEQCKSILKSFATNYVDSILPGKHNYDLDEYDIHAR